MYNKLLDLEDVIVKKILHSNHSVKIYLETKSYKQTYPSCGNKTSRVHDYRYQNIKVLPLQQKDMVASLRKYYKRSRKLILTRYHKLSGENKKACDLMLLYNDDLRTAHHLKEWFYDICQSQKYSEQRKDLTISLK